jgi:crossover junction endodeoxyribonuclease RuvC
MTATYFLGIDPGASGALALYVPAGTVSEGSGEKSCQPELVITDMPTLQITTNGKKRVQLDLTSLARWFDLHGPGVKAAMIEDPHAMPQQGVSSSFKFGFACGVVQAMVASQFIAVTLVRPRVWKARMGLTADKDATRKRASELLPRFSSMWSRVKDDGRAEAALLALYLSQQGGSTS